MIECLPVVRPFGPQIDRSTAGCPRNATTLDADLRSPGTRTWAGDGRYRWPSRRPCGWQDGGQQPHRARIKAEPAGVNVVGDRQKGRGGGTPLRDRVYVLPTTLRVFYTKPPCRNLNRQCSITLPNWHLLVESTCIDVVVDAAVLAGQQHQIVDDAQVPSISEVAIPRRHFQQILRRIERLKMKRPLPASG